MRLTNFAFPVITFAVSTTPAAAQEKGGVKIGVLSDMNSLHADITGKGTGVAARETRSTTS